MYTKGFYLEDKIRPIQSILNFAINISSFILNKVNCFTCIVMLLIVFILNNHVFWIVSDYILEYPLEPPGWVEYVSPE